MCAQELHPFSVADGEGVRLEIETADPQLQEHLRHYLIERIPLRNDTVLHIFASRVPPDSCQNIETLLQLVPSEWKPAEPVNYFDLGAVYGWVSEGDKICVLLRDGAPAQWAAQALVGKFVPCALSRRNILCIRSAAVLSRDGCLLIPGNSGLGKSTLAWGLASTGYQFFADSLVYLDPDGERIAACAFDVDVKLRKPTWDIFRDRTAGVAAPFEEAEQYLDKAIAHPSGLRHLQSSVRAPVVGILIPYRGSWMDPPRLIEVSKREAFMHLMSCGHVLPRSRVEEGMTILRVLVDRVRTNLVYYHLAEGVFEKIAKLVSQMSAH